MENFTLSNAARTIQCPGSLQLISRVRLEPEENRTLLEGKTADWCIARLVAGEPLDNPPYGIPVTDEMRDHCHGYLDHISAVLAEYGHELNPRYFERKSDLSWLTEDKPDWPQVTGRSDYRHYVKEATTLLVWDYKYGHKPVNAVGNPQLSGAALETSTRRLASTVRGFIYQPRDFYDGPVKEWQFDQDGIKRAAQDFRRARAQSVRPDAPLRTGPSCYKCPAAGGMCPAIQEEVEMVKTVLDAPPSMSPEEIGGRLEQVEQLYEQSGIMRDSLKSQGLHMAKSGRHVHGFKVVRSVTKRRVKDAETLIASAPLFGLSDDDVTERKPKALSKLEKAFSPEVLAEFTEKPEGRLELVTETDKRPAAIPTNAAEVFNTPAVMPNGE